MNTPRYEKLDAQTYAARINSPSKSSAYFEQFHKPLLDEAKEQAGGQKAVVLDLACGHGHEMEFMKDDPNIQLIGVDISLGTLRDSTRKNFADAHLIAADTEFLPGADNSVDVAMAVNAAIYKPEHLLQGLYTSLKPGRKCAVNFRVFGNAKNEPFYQYYIDRNCPILDQEIQVQGEIFHVKVIDYRNCTDVTFRNLDRQLYFQSTQDIERLATIIGFTIADHQTFMFASEANPQNENDVYTFQKPQKGTLD